MHDHLVQFDNERNELGDISIRKNDDPNTLVMSRHGSFISTAADDSMWIGVAGLKGQEIASIQNPAGFDLRTSIRVISSDGKRIAWEKLPSSAIIGDLATGEQVEFNCQDGLYALAFAPDNTRLAVCARSGLFIWNCVTREVERELPVAEYVVFSADGTRLVAARVTELCVYDTSTGRLQQQFVNRPSRITAMDISPDNRTLAISTRLLNRVELLDVRSGQDLISLEIGSLDISSIAFSPRGDRLAAVGNGEDGGSRIWEWTTTREHLEPQ
jgi:WD40 repeat protein